MVYKKFGVRVVVMVVLIVLLSLACGWSFLSGLYLTAVFTLITIIISAGALVYFVQRTNRELARLIMAIRYNDFSQQFPKNSSDHAFADLYNSFNEILSAFRKTRLEKEEQFQYLQTVVEHVSISLLAFDEDGKVELYNQAAKQLIGIPYLRIVDDVARLQPGLAVTLKSVRPGEQLVIKMNEATRLQQVAVRVEDFVINRRKLRLVSLQDIGSELERKELDTWQKMIRVLTHEIMNSVTPITSLSATIIGFLEHEGHARKTGHLSDESIEDALAGLYTIRKRSEGLTHFVQRYRALMRLPQPVLQTVNVKKLYQRIVQLMATDFNTQQVALTVKPMPEHLSVNADPELLEQVLINIVKNALQAAAGIEGAKVELGAGYLENENDKVVLRIADNGCGIATDIQDKIFIPFFSTKEGGSGIGLSLSQQIIHAHGGKLHIYSQQGQGAVVSVILETAAE